MFTVKFFKRNDEVPDFQTTVACPNYSVYTNESGTVTITTYPTLSGENGVARLLVSDDEQSRLGEANILYDICVIDNENGKTIHHIKQPK